MTSYNGNLTCSQLKEILHYNPDTGIFTWLTPTSNRVKIGDVSGCVNGAGYIQIKILGNSYFAHRLAFLYIEGRLPEHEVDHINHKRDDNRWGNLRCATASENQKNRPQQSNNTSGCTGVYWNKSAGKWQASICVRKTIIHLGLFAEKTGAIKAREAANIKYNFHKNHGAPATISAYL